jgi:archaetidylinositol phosphate synthase
MATITESFKQAERSHTSLLAAAEKRTLIWIAERLPAWVNSDHLTALGFLSLMGAGAFYWYTKYNPLALLVVIVSWF